MIPSIFSCFCCQTDSVERIQTRKVLQKRYEKKLHGWVVNPEPLRKYLITIASEMNIPLVRELVVIVVEYMQSHNVFGPAHWQQYLGVTVSKYDSPDIETEWCGAQDVMGDNDVIAIYRPAQVDGQALTPNVLETLVSRKLRVENQPRIISFNHRAAFENLYSAKKDTWILVPSRIIPAKRDLLLEPFQTSELVPSPAPDLVFEGRMGDKLPQLLLSCGWNCFSVDDAILVLFTHFIRTGEWLFSETKLAFYCLETIKHHHHRRQATIRFNGQGLVINERYDPKTDEIVLVMAKYIENLCVSNKKSN